MDVQNYVKDNKGAQLNLYPQQNKSTPEQYFSGAEIGFRIQYLLKNLLQNAYQHDKIVKSLIAAKNQGFQKIPANLAKQGIKLAIGNLMVERSGISKRLYLRRKMYAPNDKNLQLFLLQQHHDPPTQSHPGFKPILRKLQENWFWIGMANSCKQYATNCATSSRTKAYNTKKQSLLNPLPIPNVKVVTYIDIVE